MIPLGNRIWPAKHANDAKNSGRSGLRAKPHFMFLNTCSLPLFPLALCFSSLGRRPLSVCASKLVHRSTSLAHFDEILRMWCCGPTSFARRAAAKSIEHMKITPVTYVLSCFRCFRVCRKVHGKWLFWKMNNNSALPLFP